MITWKEGEHLSLFTHSIQLKALLLVQIDCGFRPREIANLRYGDVAKRDGLAIIRVHSGKTGRRIVLLRRAIIPLEAWLQAHPTKDPQDPLWVMEYPTLSRSTSKTTGLSAYTYSAMAQRIKRLGKAANFKKPLDFYNLRHSSCVLDKLDNLPNDLAADRHGHSVTHYTQTYGRLSTEDQIHRFNRHYLSEKQG